MASFRASFGARLSFAISVPWRANAKMPDFQGFLSIRRACAAALAANGAGKNLPVLTQSLSAASQIAEMALKGPSA
jgi:hypothetical protein